MTKVLLTTIPAPKRGSSPFFCEEKRQPLGLGYISACLKKEGIEVDFVDNYAEPRDMRKYIQETKPDFVGIYVNSICWQEFLKMFNTIKDLNTKFVCGGPHCSLMPDSLPQDVDHVVIGEGEKAMVDIVKGKVNSRIVCYPHIEDINELPDPDYTIFEGTKYWEHMEFLKDKPVMPLNTSRGCPMGCNFCGVSHIWGNTYRFLSADRIMGQIKHLMKTYGTRSFYLREDNFTLNRERVEEFCKMAKTLNIEWVCESRIDNLDKELLEKMKESGLQGIYAGLEAGTDRVLKLMNKGITVKMIREKVTLMKSMGIKIMGSFVINIPRETGEEVEKTINFAHSLNLEVTNINVFAGMLRSKFYDDLLKSGDYEKIDDCFIIRPNGYSQLAKRIYGFSPL